MTVKEKKTVMLSRKTHRELRRLAVIRRKRISDIMQEAVMQFLMNYPLNYQQHQQLRTS